MIKSTVLSRIVASMCMLFEAGGAAAADAATGPQSAADFSHMTLEDLANVEISSVSKKPERLADAAAAVFVITHEDIRRSGYNSIPEILRLAPNLQVARVNASQYAISARGFNSTTANKLLVLIDGRSVYTPLYSGVFWDVQDTMIEDIERIEVISGPGGTLWGANAVNGVINIITRSSRDTTGSLVSVGAGNDGRDAAARYGGRFGDNATYRIYAKGLDQDHSVTARGASAQDNWNKQQGGFRVDWGAAGNTFTLQGDAYDGTIEQPLNADKKISGGNLLGRWDRTFGDGSSLQVQAYYDSTRRIYPGTFGEVLDTYDVDVQHRFKLGQYHEILWGGGYRLERDDVTNSAMLAFLPAKTDLSLANVFLQDSVALGERLQLTVGAKLERNNYTGFEVEPNARLAWKQYDNTLLWTAVSRAVRTPSRLDRDLFSPSQAPFQIAGGANFESEKLTAYEIGYRAQPTAGSSFSVSTFYNVYDELRSLEPSANGALPYVLSNKMEGHTYGVETWGSYRVNDWWQLSAGYNYLKKALRFKSDSHDPTGVQSAGNDPSQQVSLRSQMNLAHNLELDIALRTIGGLPNPDVPGYTSLDGRLGWSVSKGLEISLAGSNLLNRRHPEFGTAATRSEFGRAVYLKILWKSS